MPEKIRRKEAVKLDLGERRIPQYNCKACGQQVGGWRVKNFMGDTSRMRYCPNCGTEQIYTEEEVLNV